MQLSQLIISHPEVKTFEDLTELVVQLAREGETFLEFDIKPDYGDTPRNWELKLEAAFYWGDKVKR